MARAMISDNHIDDDSIAINDTTPTASFTQLEPMGMALL